MTERKRPSAGNERGSAGLQDSAQVGLDPSDPWFQAFMAALVQALGVRIRKEWKEDATALVESGEQFLQGSSEDLARWSGLMASGALRARDFQWLVQARTDLSRLKAIGQIGNAKGGIDRFRNVLIETLLSTAFAYFLSPKSSSGR
jgi:hypothetical protein